MAKRGRPKKQVDIPQEPEDDFPNEDGYYLVTITDPNVTDDNNEIIEVNEIGYVDGNDLIVKRQTVSNRIARQSQRKQFKFHGMIDLDDLMDQCDSDDYFENEDDEDDD